jgi:hypothetical protein
MPFNVYTQTSHLTLKIIILSIGMILICSIVTFANETGKDRGKGTQVPKKPIEQVLKEHTGDLMSLPGVVGTGQGLCSGQPCIKVFVSKKTAKLEKRIPKNLEGYPVVIQETGKFKALPDN